MKERWNINFSFATTDKSSFSIISFTNLALNLKGNHTRCSARTKTASKSSTRMLESLLPASFIYRLDGDSILSTFRMKYYPIFKYLLASNERSVKAVRLKTVGELRFESRRRESAQFESRH